MDESGRRIPNDIGEIERLIESLPKGVVSEKKINGKIRYYHQWYEGSKQHTRYVKAEDYQALRDEVEYRKLLQKRLKELTSTPPKPTFSLNVVTGNELGYMVEDVMDLEKRDCFDRLVRYLKSKNPKVCVLYGLRRTGKTTMMLQAMGSMSDEDFAKAAYITVNQGDTMPEIRHDLRLLREQGFRYVFIDEATWIRDFIGSASYFSDVAVMSGLRVVLAGTDSLGFWFTEDDVLYGKTTTIHTTYIPYSEHSRLLGIDDIDDYIRYGGVLRQGEMDIENPDEEIDDLTFYDERSASRYIDIAIARNIQNSLKYYNWGSNFRSLYDLYGKGQLTDAINRVIEDVNHRFLTDSLNEDYESANLTELDRNTSKLNNGVEEYSILAIVDRDQILQKLKTAMNIMDISEGRATLTDANVIEIKQYLVAIDVIAPMPAKSADTTKNVDTFTLCIQPGMRFCQAEQLISALDSDPGFSELPAERRDAIMSTVENTVFGHILEEMTLYETKRMLGEGYDVFKLYFTRGDIDMVILDKRTGSCVLFEIKHSKSRVPTQYLHLMNTEKCEYIERNLGRITGRFVLYRGEDAVDKNEMRYLNVGDFLKGLPGSATALIGNNE